MITEFDEYSDLPFSKRIQDELEARHSHRDLPGGSDEIVYTEADVLILLQMMQEEPQSIYLAVGQASNHGQGFSTDRDALSNWEAEGFMRRVPAFKTVREAEVFISEHNPYDFSEIIELPVFPKLITPEDDRRERLCALRKRRKHLRLSLIGLNFADPFKEMERLCIKYMFSITHSIAEQVWFFGCENIPTELPGYIDILEITERQLLRCGLSQGDIYEMKNCEFESHTQPAKKKIDYAKLRSVPGLRRLDVTPCVIDGKTMVRITTITEVV